MGGDARNIVGIRGAVVEMTEQGPDRLTTSLVREYMGVDHFLVVKTVDTVGPFEPKLLSAMSKLAEVNCVLAANALTAFSRTELRTAFSDDTSEEWARVWSLIKGFDDRLERLRKTPWFAGGVGHTDHKLNYKHWSAMAKISFNEAFCLSVGVEPKSLTIDAVREAAVPSATHCSGNVCKFLMDRHEQLRRRFDTEASDEIAIQMEDFTGCMHQFDLEVTVEFRRFFLKRFGYGPNAEPSEPNGKSDQREFNSVIKLLTLIGVVAQLCLRRIHIANPCG